MNQQKTKQNRKEVFINRKQQNLYLKKYVIILRLYCVRDTFKLFRDKQTYNQE